MDLQSKQIALAAPVEAQAALYFLPGQYLFKQIEAGRETTKALSTAQVSLAFRDYRIDTGWMRRRILRLREEPAGNFILSAESAGVRTIKVENKAGEVREIDVPLPTLVLFGKAKEYYLWALAEKRVAEKSLLALAPLPNIGSPLSGKICFGGNEVPECKAENLDRVWNLLFDTPFNSHQASGKCKSEPEDVRELLFKLSEKGARRFPKNELVKSEISLEKIWEHLTNDKPLYRF